MAKLTLQNISKSYGTFEVLRDVSLEIPHGEFLALLGPSGSGKSTLLRIIAGLEMQDAGSVIMGDQVVDHWRPKDRDVAMVFQSYALYPHMTVAENMALPLKMRRLNAVQRLPLVGPLLPGSRSERVGITDKVHHISKSLDIAHLLDCKPSQLSGGQRQRVALARAIVRNPAMFLMDEPLSSLDVKLRAQMRTEISDLRRKVDATFVYVTHDQTEAMTMSDRVAIMFDGRIEQVGPPHVLYRQPATLRVAEFIGSPRINLLDGVIRTSTVVEAGDSEFQINCDLPPGTRITLGIRPEAFHSVKRPGPGILRGRVERLEYLGSDLHVYFCVSGNTRQFVLRASPQQLNSLQAGDEILVTVDGDQLLLFDGNGHSIQTGMAMVPLPMGYHRS